MEVFGRGFQSPPGTMGTGCTPSLGLGPPRGHYSQKGQSPGYGFGGGDHVPRGPGPHAFTLPTLTSGSPFSSRTGEINHSDTFQRRADRDHTGGGQPAQALKQLPRSETAPTFPQPQPHPNPLALTARWPLPLTRDGPDGVHQALAASRPLVISAGMGPPPPQAGAVQDPQVVSWIWGTGETWGGRWPWPPWRGHGPELMSRGECGGVQAASNSPGWDPTTVSPPRAGPGPGHLWPSGHPGTWVPLPSILAAAHHCEGWEGILKAMKPGRPHGISSCADNRGGNWPLQLHQGAHHLHPGRPRKRPSQVQGHV